MQDPVRRFVAGPELPEELPDTAFGPEWEDAALEPVLAFMNRRLEKQGK